MKAWIRQSPNLELWQESIEDQTLERDPEMIAEAEQQPYWFESEGQYCGLGTVQSSALTKPIEGEFVVAWDSLKKLNIVCKPSNLEFSEIMLMMNATADLTNLQVHAEKGTFTAPKIYLQGISTDFSGSAELTFSALRADYRANQCSRAAYWSVPVINLVTNFRSSLPVLEHKLRIARKSSTPEFTSSVLNGLREAEANRLVRFEFAGHAAFIEPMSSYKESKKRLEEGLSQYEITCMMVGSVPQTDDTHSEDILACFPRSAFLALDLACESSPGFAFVDIRDDSGKLCERFHISYRTEPYEGDSGVIDDLIQGAAPNSGLSSLIDSFIKTEAENLRRCTLLTNGIKIAKSQLSRPDHAFSTIVRVLDGLSNELGLNRRDLLLELPEQERATTKLVLRDSQIRIASLAREMVERGAPEPEVSTLRRIADRVLSSGSTEDSFGLTIKRLLQKYNLKDEEAIADCYRSAPRFDGLSWSSALNKYRGQAIHRGFIDYADGIPISDVVAMTRHLIDVATRICLREVGYAGTYNPANSTYTQTCSLDYFQGEQQAVTFELNGKKPQLVQTAPA